MARNQPTYTPVEAAEFLGISVPELRYLTEKKHMHLFQQGTRKYYLGGHLDAMKDNILSLLGRGTIYQPSHQLQ